MMQNLNIGDGNANEGFTSWKMKLKINISIKEIPAIWVRNEEEAPHQLS
jgi:hypothetical protein